MLSQNVEEFVQIKICFSFPFNQLGLLPGLCLSDLFPNIVLDKTGKNITSSEGTKHWESLSFLGSKSCNCHTISGQVVEMLASSKCKQSWYSGPRLSATMQLHPYPLYVSEFSDDRCAHGLHGATHENLPLNSYMEKVRQSFAAKAC